tara:strand:+ start:12139 stop:12354 length:216 start_codon:yes stop_codon:yes gene_type:complete
MFKKSSAKMINFFKKITNGVKKFLLKVLIYVLQIVGMTIIMLIVLLVIIAAILLAILKKAINYNNSNGAYY